jgi:hypothetical protein
MKSAFRVGVVLAAYLALLACAGVAARQHTLLPAMKSAWPGVAADVERGAALAAVDVVAEVGSVTIALESGHRGHLLVVDWPRLRQLALDGINARAIAGEIGPGVASSLRERLRLFDEAWFKVLEK